MISEIERFEKAEKIQAKDYKGWVFWEDHGDNEGFFSSVAELRTYCNDVGVEPPPYVYACKAMLLSMNAEWIIEDALEEHHENARDSISKEAEDELQSLLNAWCAKQTVRTWFQDTTRVVLPND